MNQEVRTQSKKRGSTTTDDEPKPKKQRLSVHVSQNWKNLQKQLSEQRKPTVNYKEIRQTIKSKSHQKLPDEQREEQHTNTQNSQSQINSKTSQSQSKNSQSQSQQNSQSQSKNLQSHSQNSQSRSKNSLKKLRPTSSSTQITKVLGLDCEMVGVGPGGIDSALARVTIVNSYGTVIYDKHVQVPEKITDYRTPYSGIRKNDLTDAATFAEVQKEVAELIKDRIVVGHGLKNDFRVLMLNHPFALTRDTARYGPLQRRKGRPFALRHLTKTLFGVQIQKGEHNPGEDARAAVLVYKHVKDSWEKSIKAKRLRKKKKSTQTTPTENISTQTPTATSTETNANSTENSEEND